MKHARRQLGFGQLTQLQLRAPAQESFVQTRKPQIPQAPFGQFTTPLQDKRLAPEINRSIGRGRGPRLLYLSLLAQPSQLFRDEASGEFLAAAARDGHSDNLAFEPQNVTASLGI